jgi:hypothetical protein
MAIDSYPLGSLNSDRFDCNPPEICRIAAGDLLTADTSVAIRQSTGFRTVQPRFRYNSASFGHFALVPSSSMSKLTKKD